MYTCVYIVHDRCHTVFLTYRVLDKDYISILPGQVGATLIGKRFGQSHNVYTEVPVLRPPDIRFDQLLRPRARISGSNHFIA